MKSIRLVPFISILILSTIFVFSSCTKNNFLEIDEDIDQVDPDIREEEPKAFFRMIENGTNRVLVDLDIAYSEALQSYDIYGTANSGFEVDEVSGDTTYNSVFAIGVSDSIQILWQTETKDEPHSYSYDADDPTEGEVFYLIINPVTENVNYVFGMKKLSLELTSIGEIGELMEGNFSADIHYSEINNPVFPLNYTEVTVEFAVPRYQ